MLNMFEILTKKSSIVKNSVSIVLSLSLVACASNPVEHQPRLSPGAAKAQSEQVTQEAENRDVVVEANPDQVRVTSDTELGDDPDLPLQDLDAQTLEELLVMNFASFQGDWPSATQSAIAAASSSKDFRVARSATMFALQSSDYDKATEAATVWLALKPDNINAQNMNILALVGSDQVEAAKLAIEEQIVGQNIDDYVKQLAGLLVRQRSADAGFEVAEYMVQQYPNSAQVHASAAYVAQTFKKYEAAEFWVDKSLALKPGWDLAAQLTANLLREQNKLDQRALFIDQFVKDFPHSIAMRVSHAAELGRAEKFDEAYELMVQVLKDSPDDVDALQYAAALAEQLQDNKKSRAHLNRALRVEPRNDELRWSLGRLAVVDKKYATAERLFDEIQDEALYVRAQIQVANMRNETQGVRLAVNTLKALQPRTESDYLQIAITRHYLLMSAHEYDEAFGYINETLVYLPDNLELLYARALVAAELGNVSVTETDLTKILAQQPEHANALNALGYTLADQTDRYEEAKEFIVKALALRPNDAHILDSMGWVAYRLNDFETAIEYLQKAYEASPEAEVAAHLAEVLWESGDCEKANALFRKSFAEESDNPVLNRVIERYGIELNEKDGVSASPSSDELSE